MIFSVKLTVHSARGPSQSWPQNPISYLSLVSSLWLLLSKLPGDTHPVIVREKGFIVSICLILASQPNVKNFLQSLFPPGFATNKGIIDELTSASLGLEIFDKYRKIYQKLFWKDGKNGKKRISFAVKF